MHDDRLDDAVRLHRFGRLGGLHVDHQTFHIMNVGGYSDLIASIRSNIGDHVRGERR